MKHVYIVQHAYELESGQDIVKEIGAYSTHKKAKEAVKRFRDLPGFKEYKDGFHVTRSKIGEYSWQEGFFTHIGRDGCGYTFDPRFKPYIEGVEEYLEEKNNEC
ncbi:MAG: hypothetical protein FJX18_07070 [Alphaproteobacteria bacterium]|nr:hypothetical protein [Alphaproteobacteria bacterium]